MNILADPGRPVTGRVDREGRLHVADPPLAELNSRANGGRGDMLAVPQIAALARLARRLGITVSRAAVAADGDQDLDLWVRAEPQGDDVHLSITGWEARPSLPAPAPRDAPGKDFLRASADWTWETDDSLRITALSAAAAPLLGRDPGELIGRPMTQIFRFRESEGESLPLLAALAAHQSFEGQVAEMRDASKRQFLLSGVPLIDGMGRFAGYRGGATSMAPDVREGEASGRSAQASSAFSERLDGALRAPLASIIETAERLRAQTDGPLKTSYAGYAEDIASAGRHLLALIDDLVDLQAIERPDFRPDVEVIDLADLARRAAGLLAVRAAEREVRLRVPDESKMVLADFTRTLQILVNLIGNAIRYSPIGGQVWIELEEEEDLAVLVVADQGKGIAAEDQERIFEKFERVDPDEPGGTGLGLYISRRLARAMGGELSVHSAPGQGARFSLTLKMARND